MKSSGEGQRLEISQMYQSSSVMREHKSFVAKIMDSADCKSL